jgi:hypothetical protein
MNSINESFSHFLKENVLDYGTHKAIFSVGGTGSGKDWYMKHTLKDHGLVEVDLDNLHNHLKDIHSQQHKKVQSPAELKSKLAILGRNGLLISGSGEDHEKVKGIKDHLENLGYDTSMAFVHVDDKTSQKRNIERAKNGGRVTDENIRRKKWQKVQSARSRYAKMFGNNYIEYDNSKDLSTATPEEIKSEKDLLKQHKQVHAEFLSRPHASPKAKEWIDSELTKISRKPSLAKQQPHSSSNAAKEAKQKGLLYHGKNRYGTKDEVTHVALQDKLTELPKEKEKIKETLNNTFADFLSEAVSVTYNADTTDELKQLLTSLTGNETKSNYDLSDKTDSITLGKGIVKTDIPLKSSTITNDDIKKEKQNESIMDKAYKLVQETRTGTREETRRSGYLTEGIDRNLNNASAAQETLLQKTFKGEKDPNSERPIKTLTDFRKKIKESIDKGIEPGMSMAASGENLARPADKKGSRIKKDPPLEENIGDGGEMLNTMSAQKEDELKKKGISLSSFKSKRTI